MAVGPSVENPVTDVAPGGLGVLLGLIPVGANLADKAVLGSFGLSLGLLALGLEIGRELSSVPRAVGLNNIIVPVLLYEALEILAVGRAWVRHGVIREPALQLGLMPLVVDCNYWLASFAK